MVVDGGRSQPTGSADPRGRLCWPQGDDDVGPRGDDPPGTRRAGPGGRPPGTPRAPPALLAAISPVPGPSAPAGPGDGDYMPAISFSTRSSTERNGSLQSTVRWAWSFSFRCTQSTVKSRRFSCAR